MGESEDELERRDAENRRAQEDAILDDATTGTWLDDQPGDGDRPPEGDLPDNPPAPPPSVFSRIVRALRGS